MTPTVSPDPGLTPWLWSLGGAGLGLIVGSFISVLGSRWPALEGVVTGRSRCPDCKAPLPARDLVPLVSWAVNRGRCRQCEVSISRIYPALELGCAAVGFTSLLAIPDIGTAVAATVLGWILILLSYIDARLMRLPDSLTLPLLLCGIGWSAVQGDLLAHGLTAAAGYSVFRFIAWAFHKRRGYEGLGQGDAKLLAAAGAWLGPVGLAPMVLCASLGGLLMVAGLRLMGHGVSRKTAIPFGPFLSASIWFIFIIQNSRHIDLSLF